MSFGGDALSDASVDRDGFKLGIETVAVGVGSCAADEPAIRSIHKIIQCFFQHFESFLQAQHQRAHFLPVQVK